MFARRYGKTCIVTDIYGILICYERDVWGHGLYYGNHLEHRWQYRQKHAPHPRGIAIQM